MSIPETSVVEYGVRSEELPDYTTAIEPNRHLSTLSDKSGQPWLTLRLLSEAPTGYTYPVYYDGGTVRGSVQLNLREPLTIRSVVVEVDSRLHLATAEKPHPFWQERKTIWDDVGSHEPKSITTIGDWSWDFDFPIPSHFNNALNGGQIHTVLPGSFNLKPFPAFMEHRVMLFVKRGKYFSNLVEIHTLFAYVVRERAPRPSALRELAYSQERAPPGPLADPEGWRSCDVINAKGVIFGNREVDVVYKPCIANPTTYPRGGTIFYRIEIQGRDSQGLDLLSAQSSVTVLLAQEVICRSMGKNPIKASVNAATAVDVRAVAQGSAWALMSSPDEAVGDLRVLEGEIAIPQRLSSNTDVSLLTLEYSVIFVVNAAGFVPHDRNSVISRCPIRIVSHPVLGVKPVSRIPPRYEPKVTYKETEVQWALLAIGTNLAGTGHAKKGMSTKLAFI